MYLFISGSPVARNKFPFAIHHYTKMGIEFSCVAIERVIRCRIELDGTRLVGIRAHWIQFDT